MWLNDLTKAGPLFIFFTLHCLTVLSSSLMSVEIWCRLRLVAETGTVRSSLDTQLRHDRPQYCTVYTDASSDEYGIARKTGP